jgi:hypothetical protein
MNDIQKMLEEKRAKARWVAGKKESIRSTQKAS